MLFMKFNINIINTININNIMDIITTPEIDIIGRIIAHNFLINNIYDMLIILINFIITPHNHYNNCGTFDALLIYTHHICKVLESFHMPYILIPRISKSSWLLFRNFQSLLIMCEMWSNKILMEININNRINTSTIMLITEL